MDVLFEDVSLDGRELHKVSVFFYFIFIFMDVYALKEFKDVQISLSF